MANEFGQIMQMGYIVEDVAVAAANWSARAGVGPFYVLDSLVMDQYYYRGVRVDVEMCLAFAYWGGVQIELIHPLSDTDTLYTRALKDAPGKLNHCATVVSDIDALLAGNNLKDKVIQSGKMPTGLNFVYLEEQLPGGLHLELIEAQESTLQAFTAMQRIAAGWDGKTPLRPMAAIAEDIAALQKV